MISRDTWTRLRGWVGGITGVLVVIPALINAGVDVYNTAMSVPKTEAEQINKDLFKKYFNKNPVIRMPIPILTDLGTIGIQLSVYEGGDIFVEYGDYTQWFPFHVRKQAERGSIVSVAYAQPTPQPEGQGEYTQIDKRRGNKIIREQYYSNGVKETKIIDANTGRIEDRIVTKQADHPPGISDSPKPNISEVPIIDLRRRPP